VNIELRLVMNGYEFTKNILVVHYEEFERNLDKSY